MITNEMMTWFLCIKGQEDSAMSTNETMTWFLCRRGQEDSAVITAATSCGSDAVRGLRVLDGHILQIH